MVLPMFVVLGVCPCNCVYERRCCVLCCDPYVCRCVCVYVICAVSDICSWEMTAIGCGVCVEHLCVSRYQCVCCVGLCVVWICVGVCSCVFLYELLCMCVDACVLIGLDQVYVTVCMYYSCVCAVDCVCMFVLCVFVCKKVTSYSPICCIGCLSM